MRYGIGTLVLAAFAAAGPAMGATLDVPGVYPTIQDAITAASAGDTVLVAAGTYDDLHHPGGADTTQCVAYMKSGVTLLGAGAGLTVIDALHGGRGIHCDGVTNAHIEGLTVTNAFAQVHAAGILCAAGSSPSIADCEITACDDGGIICLDGSSPAITDCAITNNESKQGGGISAENDSSPVFTRCEITGNAAPVAGGVYVKNGGSPIFDECAIDDNVLNTVNGKGGGVAVSSAQITLTDCTVNRNVSSGVGGGFHLEDGAYALVQSTEIRDNSTTADYGPGGGIYAELSEMDLEGCTIAGNTAPGATADGGGIFLFFASATTISGCTIADNGTAASPEGLGAGITCFAFANPLIENTIIAFNGPGEGLHCTDGTSAPVVTCSDLWGNEDGDSICGIDSGDNFSADPLFCDLDGGDFTLDPASPCLGGGCGQVGAHGAGTCSTDSPVVSTGSGAPRGPFASPNPFRTASTIRFSTERAGAVTATIYDVRGRVVRRLRDGGVLGAGPHAVVWDGRDDDGGYAPGGVYFCRIEGGTSGRSARVVLRR
jgi:hypothetical protein